MNVKQIEIQNEVYDIEDEFCRTSLQEAYKDINEIKEDLTNLRKKDVSWQKVNMPNMTNGYGGIYYCVQFNICYMNSIFRYFNGYDPTDRKIFADGTFPKPRAMSGNTLGIYCNLLHYTGSSQIVQIFNINNNGGGSIFEAIGRGIYSFNIVYPIA